MASPIRAMDATGEMRMADLDLLLSVYSKNTVLAPLLGDEPVRLFVRRKVGGRATGRATPLARRITITVGEQYDRCYVGGYEALEELLLHELTHIAVGSKKTKGANRQRWHGKEFKAKLRLAAAEQFGVVVPESFVSDGRKYDLDEALRVEMRILTELRSPMPAAAGSAQ